MAEKIRKYAFLFGTLVFLLSMAMFYYLFTVIVSAPLEFQNHVGFFLWSATPALLLVFYARKKKMFGFSVLLVGFITASTSMISEIISSIQSGAGTFGAVFGYILIMVVTFVFSMLIEVVILIFKSFRRNQ